MAKPKSCRCVSNVNKRLADQGVVLSHALAINCNTGTCTTNTPLLAVEWIGKKPQGKLLPVVVCSHCPICGRKK